MNISVQKPSNSLVAIQRCGYAYFVDPRSRETSFTRRLGRGFYPRFHLYVEERGNDLVLKLHLDQKRPSYGVGHAHSGEYEGQLVSGELMRIVSLLKSKNV